ncbi:hypothetical protein OCUBac02_15890 [Bosea sp. ANAM02]|nr:hypothetical protein OCUBac02_15890 [Bosea sp. ANAM02]
MTTHSNNAMLTPETGNGSVAQEPLLAAARRLLPEGSPGAVTHHLPTQWPRPGGVALQPLPNDAFTSDAFTKAYQPGFLISIYAAGCGRDHANAAATGLLGLARTLKAALHKVGVTTQTDPRNRMREMSKVHYGALTITADGNACSDLGYNTWALTHILPHNDPLPNSPVSIGEMVLNVRLPHDLPAEEFDKRLDKLMRNALLNDWLQSLDGKRHCGYLGIYPETLSRKTVYRFSKSMRRSDTAEIYFFRPKSRDADRLVRLAEVIIYSHVTQPQNRPQVSYRSLGQGLREDFKSPAA